MRTTPNILWIGDESPTSLHQLHIKTEVGDVSTSTDLVVLSQEKIPHWKTGRLEFLKNSEAPIALVTGNLSEADLRFAVNSYPIFRLLPSVQDLISPEFLAEIEKLRHRRQEHETVLLEASRRTRELEGLTEKLEQVVVERTGVLEASTLEERDKLARERQLIRFLSEVSTARDVEDLIRVLRRELRRFHRVQSLLIAVRDGEVTHYFWSQGDKVLRAETTDPLQAGNEKDLRQILANRFSRPFNKLLVLPLDAPSKALGFFGVEYSLLGDVELQELTDLLQDRSRATGMAVERLASEDRQRRFVVRWERTFDSLRDPIAVIDSEMQVLRGNRSFSENAQRKPCFAMFAGRSTPCEGCPVVDHLQSHGTLEGSVRVGHRIYRLRSWPVREEGTERVSGRVTHYDDITESRELSLRMLQNEKMSAIGELAGHIAHELNNPLTGIRSLAQVLTAETSEPGLKDDLAHIENAARRCQEIIRHLLEFSQGGQGQPQLMSLDDIVSKTLPLLKTSLRRHKQEFLLDSGEALILVDPNLLQQVIFNLLNNACQAMVQPGRVQLQTRVFNDRGLDFVELTVGDTGPGISPEIRDRLFEPFVTTKREGEGTGLGLSTSKAIVERFEGEISFESQAGEGTRFILRFPRRKSL